MLWVTIEIIEPQLAKNTNTTGYATRRNRTGETMRVWFMCQHRRSSHAWTRPEWPVLSFGGLPRSAVEVG